MGSHFSGRCSSSHSGVAAVLSLLLPGLGQMYNGNIFQAILWLIVTPGLWLGTGGAGGFVCHVISSYCAYLSSGDKQKTKQIASDSSEAYDAD